MNEDDWKDLTDDDASDPPDDVFVVRPQDARPDAPGGRAALPVFKVLYGPAGVVCADLGRAHRQMNIMAAMSKRPPDPRSN
ncbi:MAG TPA: hypothetical protein VGF74_03880 [Thermoleophilaceae bacterium]